MPEIILWHWLAFGVLVVVLLVLDLFVFHRTDHKPSLKESWWWTVFWISLALIFNGLLWWWGNQNGRPHMGIEFLNGYLIEKSLSMDNIFVFVVIFRFFHVPLMYQYRVLFWGILGAILMRFLFIVAGTALIHTFDWIIVVFGAFLVYTAYKLARHSGEDVHPEKNIVLKYARKYFRVSKGDHHDHGHRFFVREGGTWAITPMFLVLLVIESTDVIFAVDSIPAVFAVTRDPFIVFSSNIFAILGLRALYFLLAGVVELFRYLHYGLAAVLGFVGIKMIIEYWHHDFMPHWVSLVVIATLITISIVVSILAGKKEQKESHSEDHP